MSIGIFTDRQHQPTREEILEVLGPSRAAWESLEETIAQNYRVKTDFGFYGKNYGWALRFRKGGKALLSLYPRQDGFTVQIVLNEPGVQRALEGVLGENARRAIEFANLYPEGRWLFIRIDTDEDIDDVRRLLEIKAKPARRGN
jgi:hypothetical protein